jgi:hypothetical protein
MSPVETSPTGRVCGRLEPDTDTPHTPTFSPPVGGCLTCCYTTPQISPRVAIIGRMAHPPRCMARNHHHHGGNYE